MNGISLFLLLGLYTNAQKINGFNLEPPIKPIDDAFVKPIQAVNGEWVSLVFYRLGDYEDKFYPALHYNTDKPKWGETKEGIVEMIEMLHQNGMKVMLKPSVWFPDYGWPGDFELETETAWLEWELNFSRYVLDFAKIAEAQQVELFCFATEYKRAIQVRPQFWQKLIEQIRNVYSGKMTYAANWDNYTHIPFWNQLDYIGIDAYFPLSDEKTPSVETLEEAWQGKKDTMEMVQAEYQIPILFTEYGYRSTHRAMWQQWKLEKVKKYLPANEAAQKNGYEAIFESFWLEDWFVGGFAWYWSPYDFVAGGPKNNGYSPQNKTAEELIKEWYGK